MEYRFNLARFLQAPIEIAHPFRCSLYREAVLKPIPYYQSEYHRLLLGNISREGRFWASSWADAQAQYLKNHPSQVNLRPEEKNARS